MGINRWNRKASYTKRLYQEKQISRKQYSETRIINTDNSTKKFWNVLKNEVHIGKQQTQECNKIVDHNNALKENKKV